MKTITTAADAQRFYDAVYDAWPEFRFGDPCGICHRPTTVAVMWSPVNGFVCEPCGQHERESMAA